jgi:hypothetical protein
LGKGREVETDRREGETDKRDAGYREQVLTVN